MDIIQFSRQLAVTYSSGIAIAKCLDLISKSTPKQSEKQMVQKISLDLHSGIQLHKALRKHPKFFDPLYCNLVAIGEQTGTLTAILHDIVIFKTNMHRAQKKVIAACYYPAIVLASSAIVIAILLVKVVPVFHELLTSLDAQLPPSTIFIIAMANNIASTWPLGVILIILCYQIFFKTYRNKILINLPIFGKLIKNLNISRFASTTAIALKAGITLPDALKAAASVCNHPIYNKTIYNYAITVSSGTSLLEAIKSHNIFPAIVLQMINIGEESGKLEVMLEQISMLFTDRLNITIDLLTRLLEPLIMIILGIIVSWLISAIYLPIFSLGANL